MEQSDLDIMKPLKKRTLIATQSVCEDNKGAKHQDKECKNRKINLVYFDVYLV